MLQGIVTLAAYTMSKHNNILEKLSCFPYTNGRGKYITRNPFKESIPTGFYLYPNPSRSVLFSLTKSGATISTIEWLSMAHTKKDTFEIMIEFSDGSQKFYTSSTKMAIKKLHKELEKKFGGKVFRIRGRRGLFRTRF